MKIKRTWRKPLHLSRDIEMTAEEFYSALIRWDCEFRAKIMLLWICHCQFRAFLRDYAYMMLLIIAFHRIIQYKNARNSRSHSNAERNVPYLYLIEQSKTQDIWIFNFTSAIYSSNIKQTNQTFNDGTEMPPRTAKAVKHGWSDHKAASCDAVFYL